MRIRFYRDLSIKRKLTLVILMTSVVVLVLVCGSLVSYDVMTLRGTMAQDAIVLADVLGRNSTAALSFDDQADATETLTALAAEKHIISARLYRRNGTPFAEYIRAGAKAEFPAELPAEYVRPNPQPSGAETQPPVRSFFEHDRLSVIVPIELNQKYVGTINVRSDLEIIYARLTSYALILAVVGILVVLVTLALSSMLQRIISRPLLALADTARAVAEKKDYSVRARKESRDEIGLLTDAMNQMLSEIEAGQRALQQANHSLEGQAGQLQSANGSLQQQAEQFAQTAAVLRGASGDILALSTRLATGAMETATAVSQTSTTVEEVKHTAVLSSERTRQVSESAQQVAQISQRGKRSTEQTIADMNRIREQMRSIAASMMRLSEQTQTISGIIATVEDLAQQSNLLAVNAAIEAAKAGEHGRGFAVVAHEVKNLAEQSRQATTQVRTILNDIQKATNAAVMATEQGTKAVETGVGRSEEAGESILSLANSVSEAAQAAVQIAASSHQQLIGMDQVAEAIGSIKQASGQNAESAKQLEDAARKLSTLGERLKRLVDRHEVIEGPDTVASANMIRDSRITGQLSAAPTESSDLPIRLDAFPM